MKQLNNNKWLSRLAARFILTKRQQLVGVTLLLTIGLMTTHLFVEGLHLGVLLLIGACTYVFSALVLREDLSGWEYLTLLVLPTYFTVAVFLFYFLLPERWLTRLPIAILYAVGMYAILLTENIYNVAAERTIRLLRAAHSVGFLFTLITIFFLVETLLSLHFEVYWIGFVAIVIVFPLVLQTLWSMELTTAISTKVWQGTAVITLIIVELVVIFSFWPIVVLIEALFITTVFYSLVGMTQQYLVERLSQKTIREFFIVSILVFVAVLYTTKWGSGIL